MRCKGVREGECQPSLDYACAGRSLLQRSDPINPTHPIDAEIYRLQ